MENTQLQHHGTKGMRWGIRRYQNKDGSLTRAGKKRQAKNLEKAREAAKAKREEAKTREETRAKLLKSTDASELYKNRDLLTTSELNERLYRIDTERRLSQIAESTRKSGLDYVKKAISTYKTVDEVYSTVSNSSIGKAASKMIAKKLGLDTKSVEKFDLEALVPKLDTMSDEEIKRIANRVENMNKIDARLDKKKK